MAASRISPTEAFAKGSFQAQAVRAPGRRVAIGGLLLLAACLIAWRPPITGLSLIVVPLALFGAAVAFLASPASQFVIRKVAPALARFSPVAGQLASDSLLGSPRRTAGTVVATTLSIAFVLGLGGYMGSTKASMVRWMDDVLTSDIYVRASANFVNPDSRFPASLRDELGALPGVRSVESYRGLRVTMGDTVAMLGTIEVALMMTRVRHEFSDGNEETMLRGLVREGKVAVSENYAQLHRAGVGSVVTLTTPSGVVSFPIAAVFRDYTNDKGTIFMDRAVFLKYWHDDRVDTYDVNLLKGADVARVRDSIRALLGGRMPALVSTRREFVAEIGKAIDAFHSLVRITVFLALGVAFLGIVTSLLISVAERTREIGILKALGAVEGQIARSVALEGVTLAMVGYLLAVPLGILIALFMERTIATVFAGWRMPHTTPWGMLAELAVALPVVSAIAAFVPARQAASVKVTEAIEYE
jgi:putative ABC transport system permease protein